MIDTPNCANEVAGMASIRRASNTKRIVRILNHLYQIILESARLYFSCCGLLGLNRLRVNAKDSTEALPSLCTTAHFLWLSQLNPLSRFLEMTLLAPSRNRREPKRMDPRDHR
jgi:hypothetical protein